MFSPRSPSGSFGFFPPGTSFIWGLKLQSFASQLAITDRISQTTPAHKKPREHKSTRGEVFDTRTPMELVPWVLPQLAAPANSALGSPLALGSSFLVLRFSVSRTDLPTRSRR